MLKQKTFSLTGWGKTGLGQLYLPANKGVPAVCFFHGLGANNVNTFLQEGPFYWINKGWSPNFVMFAVAGSSSYPPDPVEMNYVLHNDPEIKQYWDGLNMMWTGLSQGGFSTLQCAANGYPGAFVPMSSPAFDANQLSTNKTYKAWAIHSDNDSTCPLQNVVAAYDKMKAKKTIPHDGHSNWNKYYDPNYKEDGKNIYEFAFGTVTPPTPEPVKEIVLQYLLGNGKKLVVYNDDTYEEIQ